MYEIIFDWRHMILSAFITASTGQFKGILESVEFLPNESWFDFKNSALNHFLFKAYSYFSF